VASAGAAAAGSEVQNRERGGRRSTHVFFKNVKKVLFLSILFYLLLLFYYLPRVNIMMAIGVIRSGMSDPNRTALMFPNIVLLPRTAPTGSQNRFGLFFLFGPLR
jgi:hypothetical protein